MIASRATQCATRTASTRLRASLADCWNACRGRASTSQSLGSLCCGTPATGSTSVSPTLARLLSSSEAFCRGAILSQVFYKTSGNSQGFVIYLIFTYKPLEYIYKLIIVVATEFTRNIMKSFQIFPIILLMVFRSCP